MRFLRSRFLWSKLHTTTILFITPIELQRAFPLQRGGVGRGTVRLLVSRYFPQSRFVEQAPHYCNSLYHSNRASTHVSSPREGLGREQYGILPANNSYLLIQLVTFITSIHSLNTFIPRLHDFKKIFII